MKLVTLVFLLFPLLALAQETGSLTGHVVDGQSHQPLAGVEITLETHPAGTVSDIWGTFKLDRIPPGSYVLHLRHLGYNEITRKIQIQPGRDRVMTLEMFPAVHILRGVEVRDTLIRDGAAEHLPYLKQIELKKQVRQSGFSDVGEYLRTLPNIAGIRKGGCNIDPVIRGFKYSQLLVVIDDGMTIEGGCPNRMDPAVSHIEPEDIESLEVIKGPYAMRYGSSLGGVINIRTIRPRPFETFTADATVYLGYTGNPAGRKEHLAVEGGNRTLFFRFSANDKKNEDYKAGNGETVEAKSHKYNLTGQLGLKVARQHELLLSYDRSYGRGILFPTLPMDEREDNTSLTSLDYTWHILASPWKTLKVKLYQTNVDHLMDNKNRSISDTMVAVTHVLSATTGLRAESHWQSGNQDVYFGVDYRNISKDGQRTKSAIMQPTLPVYVEQIWNNAVIQNAGIFAEYRGRHKHVEWIVSARLDDNKATSDDIEIRKMDKVIYSCRNNTSDFLNPGVSMGLYHDLSRYFSAGIMIGRGVRSPDMIERFITLLPVGYDNFDYLGNPQLKPEKNNEIDLTVRFNHPLAGAAEFNLFCSYVTGFITGVIVPPAEQKPLSDGVLGVKRFQNIEPVLFRGMEFSMKTPAESLWEFTLTAAYTRATISKMTRLVLDDQSQITGEEEIRHDPLAEVPPFESTLSFSYKLFGSRLIPIAAIRVTAPQNYVSQAFYEKKTPGFVVADLRVSYMFKSMLQIYGGVNNIFNVLYYEHLNRRIIGSSLNLYEPGRNFYINLIVTI